MRKAVITVFSLFFLTFFLTTLTEAKTKQVLVPTPTPTPVPKVEYELPYPGILPDHPLYFLKVLRDRTLGFLIQDPVKRTEFNLLMADKRLIMGIFLSEKGKPSLAESTISKGEKYLEKAFSDLTYARAKGDQTTVNLVDKIKKSVAKHEEVLTELLERMPEEKKKGIEESLNLVKKIKEELKKI